MSYTLIDEDAKGRPCTRTTPTNPPSSPTIAPSNTPVHLYAAAVTSHERYDGRTSVILGAIHIAGGLLAILDQILLLCCLYSGRRYLLSGIWVGILYIIVGSFGVAAGKIKTPCLIVTYMILAITFLVISTGLVLTAAMSLADDEYRMKYSFHRFESVNGTHNYYLDPTFYYHLRAAQAVNSLQLIVYVCEFITLIWGSTLACKVTCCSPPQQQIPLVAQVKYENGQACLVLASGSLPQGENAGPESTQDGGVINTTLQSDEQKSQFV